MILCLALMAAGAGPTQAEQTRFVIAGSGWIGDAPTRIADHLGYFEAARTSKRSDPIVVNQYGSGRDALQALLRGEVDFALAAPEPVALAVLTQAGSNEGPERDIIVLASLALSSMSHHVVANRRQGIERPGDLAGKRIGLVVDTSAHHAWHRFSHFHRVSATGITIIDTPIDRLADAFRADSIDAAVIWDPWTADLINSLGSDARVFSTRELHTIDWFLVARRHTIADRPDIADRVIRGYTKAIDLIYRDPEKADRAHERAAARIDLRPAATGPGLVWRVSLGWSVLANMEVQFQWLGQRPELSHIEIPPPYRYLFGAPIQRAAPRRLTLPPSLSALPDQAGRAP